MTVIAKLYGDTIKVTQLHYARAAADLGSFSRAAASLGVSQPALSNGIAALERTLGGALFERSTTGVVPTPLAVRVLPHLHNVLTGLDSLLTEARGGEPLRMGVSPLIHPTIVARAFQAARQHAPAALILKEDNLAELRTALLTRRLDLILVPAVTEVADCRRRQIDSEPIHYLPSSMAGTTKNRAGGKPIELAELSGQALVMVGDACGLTMFTRTLFADAGSELCPYAGAAEDYRSLEDWAHLGLGGALLPLSRFRGDQPTRPVLRNGRAVTIAYEALWLTRAGRERAINTLLDTMLAPPT